MKISSVERDKDQLNSSTLAQGTKSLNDAGYVVLENLFSASWTRKIRQALNEELENKYRGRSDELENANNHGGIEAPLRMPFIDPKIIENPIIFQMLKQALGSNFFGHLPYGCNTAFPGSKRQNVHRDSGHIFPEIESPMPPLLIVVNIALDDFTANNGATEIWPGSHRLVDADAEESKTLRIPEHRYTKLKSTKTLMKAGSVIFRDMRTWHRGMPNSTSKSRSMLTLVYYRHYFIPDSFCLYLQSSALAQFSDLAQLTYRLREAKNKDERP